MFSKIELVSQVVKGIVILTMCHVSEFHKILNCNYTRIGLSIYVKFSLGKWLGTRQKIIQSRSQKTKSRQQLPSAWPEVSSAYWHLILQFETSALPSSINDIYIKITCSPTSVCSILNLSNWFFSCISCQYSYPTFKKINYCLKSHVCIIGCIILSVLFVSFD